MKSRNDILRNFKTFFNKIFHYHHTFLEKFHDSDTTKKKHNFEFRPFVSWNKKRDQQSTPQGPVSFVCCGFL